MSYYEVLSPAGDIESFYTAIKSGADAIYFGLNKFNARMKADNINLDNLKELVEFAHVKGVKLYVTINTLLSDAEVPELVDMVGVCIEFGVDAFIVQDLGVISTLKSVYPGIVLHGSTQLGVHNVRGARVAKELGLSRVVLSREVTLEDIKEIKENVDIELEVFVQGAMCVCFSGNCYISSLKHDASGNRGLCKQLCRLPFEVTNDKTKLKGYALSPRDNCMLKHIKDLMEIGVQSFKIEGRLRRPGYVAIAAATYRDCVDSIINHKGFNYIEAEKNLKKVFSRGEFVSGYFDGKDIIDTKHNNHMGERIGKVLRCEKFKDLYKIYLDINATLHAGDGLKIVGGETITLGVGNVEKSGKQTIIYSKNKVNLGDIVYRVLDYQFENNVVDRSRNRNIDIDVQIETNKPIKIDATSDNYSAELIGDVVSVAKTRPTTEEEIVRQFAKCGEGFELVESNINIIGQPFIAVSKLNEYRRTIIEKLKAQILDSYKTDTEVYQFQKVKDVGFDNQYNKLAIVDETILSKNCGGYSALILSPSVYSMDIIERYYIEYKKSFKTPLYINMPIIALSHDLKILDNIVKECKNKDIVLIANNVYALDYIGEGLRVMAGANLNVTNNYSAKKLFDMGVEGAVASIEKWTNPVNNLYKMCKGRRVLMTFAHCPNITLNNNTCAECSYKKDLKLKNNGAEYLIRRYKISNCYFELIDCVYNEKSASFAVDDLRG